MNQVATEIFSFPEELKEQLLVRSLVAPGMTVFDVGAHIGNYTILFSQLVGQSGKVYTFEPTSKTYGRLSDRLQEFKVKNVTAFNQAVYSENTQLEFHEFSDYFSSWNSLGQPQMLDPRDRENYVQLETTEIVEAVSLDNFCQQHQISTIDYLKIDVEGAESFALLGARQLLSQKAIRWIQFEISQKMLEGLNCKAKDTFDILSQHGYECHQIKADGTIGDRAEDSTAFYDNYIAFPTLESIWSDYQAKFDRVLSNFAANQLDRNLTNTTSKPNFAELKAAQQQLTKTVLNLPTIQIEQFNSSAFNRVHQQLLYSGIKDCPLTSDEDRFVDELLTAYRQSITQPQWEYLPEGWSTQDRQIQGWNVESIVETQKARWPQVVAAMQQSKLIANDYSNHNTYLAYGYVLALTAHKKDRISILDWGGGLGQYYILSQSLLPEVKIDYHCKDVSLLSQAGRELLPDATFYDNDVDCFQRSYDLVLASGSLHYAQDWQQVVKQMTASCQSYLYITRLPVVNQVDSFVVVQRPYWYGYQTEYIGWFLNRNLFLNSLSSLQMELVREFLISENPYVSGAPEQCQYQGFLFSPKAGKTQ